MRLLSILSLLLLVGCAAPSEVPLTTADGNRASARASNEAGRPPQSRTRSATRQVEPMKPRGPGRETYGQAPEDPAHGSKSHHTPPVTVLRGDASSHWLSEKTPSTGSPEWEREERIKEEREQRIKGVLRGICRGC